MHAVVVSACEWVHILYNLLFVSENTTTENLILEQTTHDLSSNLLSLCKIVWLNHEKSTRKLFMLKHD